MPQTTDTQSPAAAARETRRFLRAILTALYFTDALQLVPPEDRAQMRAAAAALAPLAPREEAYARRTAMHAAWAYGRLVHRKRAADPLAGQGDEPRPSEAPDHQV